MGVTAAQKGMNSSWVICVSPNVIVFFVHWEPALYYRESWLTAIQLSHRHDILTMATLWILHNSQELWFHLDPCCPGILNTGLDKEAGREGLRSPPSMFPQLTSMSHCSPGFYLLKTSSELKLVRIQDHISAGPYVGAHGVFLPPIRAGMFLFLPHGKNKQTKSFDSTSPVEIALFPVFS